MGLGLVHGQQALVELRLGRKLGLVPQQNMQERQLRHVQAHHDQANGERRGKHQPRPPPEQRPEDRHDQQRKGGDAGVGAIEPGLEDVADGELQHGEEREHHQRRSPGLEHAQREDKGNSTPIEVPM